MTDTNKQALEALDNLEKCEHKSDAEYRADIKIIRAALQPKPSVDEKHWAVNAVRVAIETLESEGYENLAPQVKDALDRLVHSQSHLNQGWRDISTAPKDDVDILVYDSETGFTAISSDEDKPYRRGFNHRNGAPATHWMSLPQPPKSEGE